MNGSMTLSGRLGRLEKESRRWKAAAGVLALVVVLLLTAGAQAPVPNVLRARTVEARTIVIQDEQGRERVRLEGDRVEFYDASGKMVGALSPRGEVRPVR